MQHSILGYCASASFFTAAALFIIKDDSKWAIYYCLQAIFLVLSAERSRKIAAEPKVFPNRSWWDK